MDIFDEAEQIKRNQESISKKLDEVESDLDKISKINKHKSKLKVVWKRQK